MDASDFSRDLVPAQPPRAEVFSWRRALRIKVMGAFLILGVLGLLAATIHPAWVASQVSKQKTEDKNQLKQIGVYLALYEAKYKAYPQDMHAFEDWLQKGGTDTGRLFSCSRCGKRLTFLFEVAPSGSFTPTGGATYEWTATGITDGAPPDLPMAWHQCSLTRNDDMNVLFFQGRVDVFAVGSPSEKAILDIGRPAPSPK